MQDYRRSWVDPNKIKKIKEEREAVSRNIGFS